MNDIKKFEPLWGVWTIEELIGEGSFGKVYRAVREVDGKKYFSAIKHISIPVSDSQIADVISEGISKDNNAVKEYFFAITQDLIGEMKLMSDLRGNPNIVSYEGHMIIPKPQVGYDIFIRMELLTGLNDLSCRVHFTEQDVIKLGIDICNALEGCAENKIVHRDIKPSNIFISDDGTYKLGDFGVARQLAQNTATISKKGTYAYMSPEVYKGEAASYSADIFSLGIVMYRLLNANRAPFISVERDFDPSENENALMRRMSGEALPQPAYAGDALAAIILKATQFDRKKRYRSAAEMKEALTELRVSDHSDGVLLLLSELTSRKKLPIYPKVAENNDSTHEKKYFTVQSKSKSLKVFRTKWLTMTIAVLMCSATIGVFACNWLHNRNKNLYSPSKSISLTLLVNENEYDFYNEVCSDFAREYADDHSDVSDVTIDVKADESAYNPFDIVADPSSSIDVFYDVTGNILGFAESNAIESFSDEYFEKIHERSDESITKMLRYNDRYYGFPYSVDTAFILYYDRKCYTDDEVKSLNTMLEKDLGRNIKNFGHSFISAYYPAMWNFTAGGELFTSYDRSSCTFDSPECVEMLKFVIHNLNKMLIYTDTSDGYIAFKEGKVAACCDGPWNISGYKEVLGDDLGVTVLPTVTVNGKEYQMKLWGAARFYGVSANSAEKETAIALAEYLSGIDIQLKKFEVLGDIPSAAALLENDAIKANPTAYAALLQSQYNSESSVSYVPNGWWSDAEEMYSDILFGNVNESEIQDLLENRTAIWKAMSL